ncbi:MAG: DUF1284 domain-containing protein [Oscillospiraceae bacterium]|nr:DUF1284 domain-containing protein [Oscillospiraceae bacterium]
MEKLLLRPHHGLCVILFDEEGHSAPYISIMRKIIENLRDNPKTKVILCRELDVICGSCSHNAGSNCGKADEVILSDDKTLSYCELEFGSRLNWEDFRQTLIDEIISKDLLLDACEGCDYLNRCRQACAFSAL